MYAQGLAVWRAKPTLLGARVRERHWPAQSTHKKHGITLLQPRDKTIPHNSCKTWCNMRPLYKQIKWEMPDDRGVDWGLDCDIGRGGETGPQWSIIAV